MGLGRQHAPAGRDAAAGRQTTNRVGQLLRQMGKIVERDEKAVASGGDEVTYLAQATTQRRCARVDQSFENFAAGALGGTLFAL